MGPRLPMPPRGDADSGGDTGTAAAGNESEGLGD